VSYLWQASGYLKDSLSDCVIIGSSLPPKCEYCIIGRGDRMTSLRQSVDRGNADRCFAVDSVDTVEPHERCWILIGLLVEPVT